MDYTLEIQLKELNKRLGIIIALLVKMLPHDSNSLPLKEQIKLLDNLGVRPKDIAIYLSRKPSHITKELVNIRRQKNKN